LSATAEEKAMSGTVDEETIVKLRDKAMVMLEEGAWHDDGKGHRLRVCETKDLRVAYAGPFQMGAEEMPQNLHYFAAATGRSGHLPHQLSVWRKALAEKVLDVAWDEAGKLELFAHEPGEWEARLTSDGGN
jgi:hypothetical protein